MPSNKIVIHVVVLPVGIEDPLSVNMISLEHSDPDCSGYHSRVRNATIQQ